MSDNNKEVFSNAVGNITVEGKRVSINVTAKAVGGSFDDPQAPISQFVALCDEAKSCCKQGAQHLVAVDLSDVESISAIAKTQLVSLKRATGVTKLQLVKPQPAVEAVLTDGSTGRILKELITHEANPGQSKHR